MAEYNRETRRRQRIKDKKITIYRRRATDEGERYTPIHPGKLWAYYRQLSGDELHVAAQDARQENVLFEVNYRPDHEEWDAIDYNGRFYSITRVDTFEGGKRDLTVYADYLARNRQPEPGEIDEWAGA